VQNEAVPPLFPGAPENLIPVGGDTQLLANFEYRIPIAGPIAVAGFFDIGSVFNLRSSPNQFIVSEFLPLQLNNGSPIILNQRGLIATDRELRQARTPENPGVVPPGFRIGTVFGERQDITAVALEEAKGGLYSTYRYSLGGEVRVQVPVINVPFRLIFAWNPNAQTNNLYLLEEKRAIRFSVGRTF
jgi:outer membrane protein insertion porin family